MASPHSAPLVPPWSGSTWLKGLLVGGWLVGCDAWLKITARVAACSETPDVSAALSHVWGLPSGCGDVDFWGIARLSPVLRDGWLLGLGSGVLQGSAGRIWAYALLAIALVVSILVVRWRWRSTGDAAALGALWGAVAILAGPRLMGSGTGLAELHIGGLATGLGDFALLWAALWLSWRALAEFRA